MKCIYLDYNATTPVDPVVLHAMLPCLTDRFGNPSSSHEFGRVGRAAVELAREQLSALFGVAQDEILFTSGGTESNNMAIKGTVWKSLAHKGHIITTSIEHPAVIEVFRWLEKFGTEVTYLPVDQLGMVDPDMVKKAIRPDTLLISVMHANNEVGTIQPVTEIGTIARSMGIPFHSDAAQSVGKILVDPGEMMVDLLSVAGHKLYAPKGIGALYIRRGTTLEKFMHGAGNESGQRAGTENVAMIAGLGAAAMVIKDVIKVELVWQNAGRMAALLLQRIRDEFPETRLNGHPEKRLPNTLSIGFPGIDASRMLLEMSSVAASAGAACHSDHDEISAVLQAMDVPGDYAIGTIRFSTGRMTTEEDIHEAVPMISAAYRKLRRGSFREYFELVDGREGQFRLTEYTHALGCACKIRPQLLERILKNLPVSNDHDLLVGFGTSDDASVYRLTDEVAVVETLDVIPPVVDDPYLYGAIAAANAISDIYAMGARPIFALSFVGFPDRELPIGVLEQILKGAHDKAAEAGIEIAGGHTIEDSEPKFGLAVTGIVDPRKILRNSTAQPGDALILTKPIGTGIIITALKKNLAQMHEATVAMSVMAELNRKASEIIARYPVNACTDITGFGLMGHLREMVAGSGVTAELKAASIPVLNAALKYARGEAISGGTRNNREHTDPFVEYGVDIPENLRWALCDAQTSGGLLISLPVQEAERCRMEMESMGLVYATLIGTVIPGDGAIRVI